MEDLCCILAERVPKKWNTVSSSSPHADAKSVWKAVRQVTGAKHNVTAVDGISAESLNNHYVSISTDQDYSQPNTSQPVQSNRRTLSQNLPYFECFTNFVPR